MAAELNKGHVAVVFGGGGAIGSACVRAFAEAGARVVSVDIGEDAAARAIEGLDGSHTALACDVTRPEAVVALARRIGAVDSVIYAAGLNADGYVADIDWAVYRQVMAVNLDGAFHVCAAFSPVLCARATGGSIVLLSSTAGLRGEAGGAIYCAGKFGLIGLTESLAAELGAHGVRVNAVCPGNVDSPMLREVAANIATRTGEDASAIWQEMTHAGAASRLITPEEIAASALYLAGPTSAAITGIALRVDAGAMLSL
ncbi:SDR family NAD(P)-dependent oxidoreductase [Cucumibacter marinus]|uniref:SDR family NAD(P)-dependent oxidoreductase n=1 Tax=Cucumibacter marinus TaxID=1121252 RepID=UPI00041EB9A6|nr:SDR family oxidoreductase [Cucumibacter marinus]